MGVQDLESFGEGLVTRQDPRFLEPLGHEVDPGAPSGRVDGLAAPSTTTPATVFPQPAGPPTGPGPAVQRAASEPPARSTPTETATAPPAPLAASGGPAPSDPVPAPGLPPSTVGGERPEQAPERPAAPPTPTADPEVAPTLGLEERGHPADPPVPPAIEPPTTDADLPAVLQRTSTPAAGTTPVTGRVPAPGPVPVPGLPVRSLPLVARAAAAEPVTRRSTAPAAEPGPGAPPPTPRAGPALPSAAPTGPAVQRTGALPDSSEPQPGPSAPEPADPVVDLVGGRTPAPPTGAPGGPPPASVQRVPPAQPVRPVPPVEPEAVTVVRPLLPDARAVGVGDVPGPTLTARSLQRTEAPSPARPEPGPPAADLPVRPLPALPLSVPTSAGGPGAAAPARTAPAVQRFSVPTVEASDAPQVSGPVAATRPHVPRSSEIGDHAVPVSSAALAAPLLQRHVPAAGPRPAPTSTAAAAATAPQGTISSGGPVFEGTHVSVPLQRMLVATAALPTPATAATPTSPQPVPAPTPASGAASGATWELPASPEPWPTTVQRADEPTDGAAPAAAAEAPPAALPAPAPAAVGSPGSPAAGAGKAGTDLDELARRLYGPMSALLRAELWLDRERSGRSLGR